ncbi:MAG: ABC transporter permease, partial [Bacteroidales bacterium]|nr:ABC transporter permease [Bacteroidales bacterium]
VGVVKDFNFKSASYPVTPLVLLCWGANGWRSYNMAYVKLAPGNPEDAIKYIKKTVCEFDSNYSESTVEVSFMDESIEYQYKSLISLRKLITIASLVALLIAIIGIIGLVYFETQFISKDIAVRRVNGATVEDILRMINRKYVIISLVSFVISVPLALMIILGWRSSFAYQAPVPVWIFAVTLIGITLLTVAVVTWQSWKAANANPVDSLKNE